MDELIDMAIYKEVASEALYTAAQSQTTDPGAIALMKELAGEEQKHLVLLKTFKAAGTKRSHWHPEKVPALKMSEYLTAADTPGGAGIQDTLIFAMKREQESMEFYSRMMSVMRSRPAKQLCQTLAREELKHRFRLEIIYDGMFYKED